MNKVELALIMTIIDKYTVTQTYNYACPDVTRIENVDKLKQEILNKYEEVMKDADN